MKKKLIGMLAAGALALASCTNLEPRVYDEQVTSDFYATPAGITSALADIYGEIRGDWGGKGVAGADRGWYDMNEVCTDEVMIPRRSDGAWDDNGIWRQMYRHTWTAGQPFMENTWNWLYRAVYKANLAEKLLVGANAAPARIAEVRVLRAYFYYMLMDAWGGVPYYTNPDVKVEDVPQITRAQVYENVVRELVENVDKLDEATGGNFYGRFNKWAGYTLLAKVYLNAQVYTGTPRWAEAIAACDRVINSGKFSLVSGADYFSMFRDVRRDNEVILGMFVDSNIAPRNIIGIRTLRGPHGEALFGFSTWNGSTAHANFVNKYLDIDIRKAQWLLGPQPGGVNYTLTISSLDDAGVNEGARNSKFLPQPPYNGGSSSNDFTIFRYADVLLMKAEASVRNGNATAATAPYNLVRQRAGLAANVSPPTLDDIYDERGRELCWEGHRRQDMIRFGRFLAARDFKGLSDTKYLLFPIPAQALANNRTLRQNPGY